MTADLALWLLLAAAVLVVIVGQLRYRTLLNPLTINTIMDTGLITIVPGVFAYQFLTLGKYTEQDLVDAAALSGLYLFGSTVPYLFRGSTPALVFGRLMAVFGLRSSSMANRFSHVKFGFLLVGALLAFAGLAITGGGGTLWLTEPRAAYIAYRTGAGQFWLLTAWFHTTMLLYYLWAKRPRGLHLLFIVVLFVIAAYYLGSKAIILTVGVVAVVYYHFMVRRLGNLKLILSGLIAVAAFVGLLFFQGSYADLAGVASYFENFQITAEFLGRFDEFGYQYGKAWLSEFWFYVPRALYSAKPLEYGSTLLQKQLLPGSYEMGYAPGFLTWSLSYLDFGWIGVLCGGILRGLVQRAGFEHFLRNKESLFSFALMMQISLWGVFAFASISVAIVWCVAQAVFLRLVLVHSHPRVGTSPARA